jgi:ABC-type Fe3+ transport system substrate-binding protein
VNLGSVSKEREYAEVEVEVPDFRGKLVKMSGHAIYFGLTMPRDSRQRAPAERFVRFVLSSRGQQALRGSGIVPLVPPVAPPWSTQMPRVLRELVGPLGASAGASAAEATD